ncbi:DnaB-like helicase N-terminal domain-containing protein [Streptomyces sp. NPDC020192]|uniref:DnaB-like helicase N-terminal domain-containing protein n=1 Tax=Streptomyces sp. NPDC020192 TaxID=3365066 RepID=UPI00378A9C12
MPHSPSDDNDDLDGLSPPPPVHYAEQSLLGALLLDPHRLDEIGPLDPDHFSNHTHGELFRGMRTVPAPDAEQHRTSPAWLNTVLDAARPHARGLTASYLHALIQVCPWPQHAATYARMIRADHARRSLRSHAERLAQTATDTTLPHRAKATVQQAEALARFLDDLSGRFASHPAAAGTSPRHERGSPRRGTPPDRHRDRVPRRDPSDALARFRRLRPPPARGAVAVPHRAHAPRRPS